MTHNVQYIRYQSRCQAMQIHINRDEWPHSPNRKKKKTYVKNMLLCLQIQTLTIKVWTSNLKGPKVIMQKSTLWWHHHPVLTPPANMSPYQKIKPCYSKGGHKIFKLNPGMISVSLPCKGNGHKPYQTSLCWSWVRWMALSLICSSDYHKPQDLEYREKQKKPHSVVFLTTFFIKNTGIYSQMWKVMDSLL